MYSEKNNDSYSQLPIASHRLHPSKLSDFSVPSARALTGQRPKIPFRGFVRFRTVLGDIVAKSAEQAEKHHALAQLGDFGQQLVYRKASTAFGRPYVDGRWGTVVALAAATFGSTSSAKLRSNTSEFTNGLHPVRTDRGRNVLILLQ